jgi:transcriptional regulator with XRE-family HTH domain
MSAVGERIRQRRVELGLSQRELASEGVSYAYVSRLEADTRRPTIRALRQLAPKLGATVHWLETGEADPAEQLARLALEHRSRPLPQIAARLARKVLNWRAVAAQGEPALQWV